MNQKLSRRKATPNDFNLTLNIKVNSIKKYVEQIWGWDDKIQFNYHKNNFQPEFISIILLDDIEIGYVELKESNESIEIINLLISEQFQNQRIGATILLSLKVLATNKNKILKLELFKINTKALSFYKNAGFELIGETTYKFLMHKLPGVEKLQPNSAFNSWGLSK